MEKKRRTKSLNELMTTVLVEQHLALPGLLKNAKVQTFSNEEILHPILHTQIYVFRPSVRHAQGNPLATIDSETVWTVDFWLKNNLP